MFFNIFQVDIDDTDGIKKLILRFNFSGFGKPTINAYINGVFVGLSEKKKIGEIYVTETDFPEFLAQGAYLQAYLTNTQTNEERRSETLSFFVIHKADSKNGWNPTPITYISDSDSNKSMILPPVQAAKGKLFHFKYLGTKRPFVLMSSLKDREYPLKKSQLIFRPKDDLSELFESTIEGAWKYSLSLPNQCVSLVSDGTAWLIVNNYEGTFTSIGKGVLPVNIIQEKNKSHFLNYYWNNDASNNILISDLRQNALKFVHIHRFLPDTGILNLYLPPGIGIEDRDISGNEHGYLSLSLSNKALLSNVASFILSFHNNRLYILGHNDGAGFTIAEYPEHSTQLQSSLTISKDESIFQLPSLPHDKQETKFFLIKKTSPGNFTLAASSPSQTTIYTPKNGLRDCITYTRPLTNYCFWILAYKDQALGGQTTAIVINKYNGE